MTHFVDLHPAGDPYGGAVTINLDHITAITYGPRSTHLYLLGGREYEVTEAAADIWGEEQ